MVRQWDKCQGQSGNFFFGTEGALDRNGITGKNPWKIPQQDMMSASVYEHWRLIDSIRNGRAVNNVLDYAADSTLTTILGREAAYTVTDHVGRDPEVGSKLGPAGGDQVGSRAADPGPGARRRADLK